MAVRKPYLVAAALVVIAVAGGGVWGYDQLRGWSMDIDAALAAYDAGNHRSAFRAAERLATAGDVVAQTLLGEMYRNGEGTDRDYPSADQWLTRAAEQGHVPAMNRLADLHRRDYHSLRDSGGLHRNLALAAEWYRRAAESGSTYAQTQYGRALIKGSGVETDTEAGLAWIMLAIDAGSAGAMDALGSVYHSGELGEEDHQLALQWYRRAARHGGQWGMVSAVELLREEGSPVFDIEEAYKWSLIGRHWWHDEPYFGGWWISVAETVHREQPQMDPLPTLLAATIAGMDEDEYWEQVRAREEAIASPESWPYRIDLAARERAEAAAGEIIARWPEPPANGQTIDD